MPSRNHRQLRYKSSAALPEPLSVTQQMAVSVEYLMQQYCDRPPPEDKFINNVKQLTNPLTNPMCSHATRSRKQRAARFLDGIHSGVNETAFVLCVYAAPYTALASANIEDGCRRLSALFKNPTKAVKISRFAVALCKRHENIVSELFSWGQMISTQRIVPRNAVPPTPEHEDLSPSTQTAQEPTASLDESSSSTQTHASFVQDPEDLSSSAQTRLPPTEINDDLSLSAHTRPAASEILGNSSSNSLVHPAPAEGFSSLESGETFSSYQRNHFTEGTSSSAHDIIIPWSHLVAALGTLDDNLTAKCIVAEEQVCGFHVISDSQTVATIHMKGSLRRHVVWSLIQSTEVTH